MYEKKINIFNSVDREIFSKTFKYNVCFFIMLLLIFAILLFVKIDGYYQNNISFIDSKKALIVVDKEYLEKIKGNKMFINDISFDFNIDKIVEDKKEYFVNVIFNSEISLNANLYRIYLGKESLLEYIIKVIKGE